MQTIRQSKASEVAMAYERALAITEELAESTTARLKPLGFDGFSAKMIQADINARLAEENLQLLNLPQIKSLLLKIGYAPQELAWHPMAGVNFSAWTRGQK